MTPAKKLLTRLTEIGTSGEAEREREVEMVFILGVYRKTAVEEGRRQH